MELPNFPFLSNLRFDGVWWHPDQPDKQTSGLLAYQPGTFLSLDLLGYLPIENDATDEIVRFSALHGITREGTPITLADVARTNHVIHFGGITCSTFAASRAFVGAHLASPDDAPCEAVAVSFTHLEEWADTQLVRVVTHIPKYEVESVRSLLSGHLPSLPATFSIDADLSVKYDVLTRFLTDAALTMCFRFEAARPWREVHALIYDLELLMTLLVGEPLKKRALRPTLGGRPVQIFGNQGTFRTDALKRGDLVASLPVVKDSFLTMVDTWLSNADRFRNVYNLLAPIFNPADVASEFVFLALMQALESYHRNSAAGLYVDPKDYEPIKSALEHAIPAGIDSDHRQSLKSRIRFGNEYSLRRRLRELLDRVPPELDAVFDGKRAGFMDDVVNNRNFLTHYAPELASSAIKGEGLWDLNERLTIILVAILLVDLGLVPSSLATALGQKTRWRDIMAGTRPRTKPTTAKS